MASLTSVGDSVTLSLSARGDQAAVALSGTYAMVVELQREQGSPGSGSWEKLKSWDTADATVAYTHTATRDHENLRVIVTTDTSGTCVATLTDALNLILNQNKDEAGNLLIEDYQAGHRIVNVPLTLGSVPDDVDGLLMGIGSSTTLKELGATAGIAMDFRFNATHTTGDMRGIYCQLDFSGAGGSGESGRFRGIVNGVTAATGGTVNGIHSTLELTGAAAAVSGAGNALRATLGLGAGVTASGTLSGIQVDADFASDSTLTAAPAGIRFTTATSKKWPIAFAFDSVVGTGNAVEAATSAMSTNATAWAIHITVDGADGYIPVYDNKTWG